MAETKQNSGKKTAEPVPSHPVQLRCPSCGGTVELDHPGQIKRCPTCGERVTRVQQLEQFLARWFEPRRWRADLLRPTVPYIIERLWTSNGQGVRLYEGVRPHYTNYDIFRNLVTRLIIRGIDDGWADLVFPPDPMVEDPQYELKIVDSEKFAQGVEKLFPEVNWDETIEAPALAEEGETEAEKPAEA